MVENAWLEYEQEKKRIAETAETAEEYERLLGQVVDRLGI